MEKFLVDFANGTAIQGKHCYKLFVDAIGIYIIARKGVYYMTQENSEVL